MARTQSNITNLPRSPDDDRRSRMIKYTVTMGIRVVCIGLCLVVQGWWLVVCIAGAVILPYVAVVLANAVDATTPTVERPGSIVRADSAGSADDAQSDNEADQQ